MKYLIDKIKIFLMSRLEVENISDETLEDLQKEGFVLQEKFLSLRMMGFFSNYVFKQGKRYINDDGETVEELGEGTIFVGFKQNTYKDAAEGFKRICVEFNPQKVEFPLSLKMFFNSIGARYSSVSSCDVAFDFPGKKLDDVYVSTKRKVMYVGQANNLTRYIAPQDTNGRIKIYDKKIERSLHGEDIDQKVRVEVTMKNFNYHECDALSLCEWHYLQDIQSRLSEVHLSTNFPLLPSDDVNPAIMYLLSHVSEIEREEALHLMSKATAAKYRKQVLKTDFEPLTLDIIDFAQKTSVDIWECVHKVTGIIRLV